MCLHWGDFRFSLLVIDRYIVTDYEDKCSFTFEFMTVFNKCSITDAAPPHLNVPLKCICSNSLNGLQLCDAFTAPE